MSLWKVSRSLLSRGKCLTSVVNPRLSHGNVYEPDYLESMKPDIPLIDAMNIQLKGYDYAILESFQSHIHKLAETLGIPVEECWATPPQQILVQRYKPFSTVKDCDYKLSIYERNIQIDEAPNTSYTLLLRLIQESIPEGVSVEVREALPEHQEIRYIPDLELLNLKQQLNELGGPIKEKKKKKK